MVRKEQPFVSRFKYDIAALVCLAFVGLGMWLNQNPFTFDGEDSEIRGETPPQIGIGEMLLVVPDSESLANDFDDLDFSYAWYNSLAQEVGPFTLQVTGALAPDDLAGVHVVVVPARSATLLESPQISLLENWVKGGGSLMVEMPGPSWSQLTGVTEPVLIGRSAKAITASPGSSLKGDFAAHLLDVPLSSRIMRFDTVDIPDVKRGDILLEIDGVPVHYHRPLEAGHVFVLGFDYGMALTALQQGKPEPDFTILPLEGEVDEDELPMVRPQNLVAHPKLLQSRVPYADLLERHVLYAPLRYRPAPRLWLFPDSHLGAVVMTHEERGFGDKATYMAEHEHRAGHPSTYFVSANEMTNDGLDDLAAHGAEIGMAWHRNGPNAIYEQRGLGRVRPYQVALSLEEQKERLEGWAGMRVHAGRVHELEWDPSYTSSFRKLSASGLYMDSSYGPSEDETWGYLFGTGLPFYPIDMNGLPLPIYELPFVVSNNAGFGPDDEDLIQQLIQESRSGFHNVLTFDIDADAMSARPRPETLDVWLRALDLAVKEKHWVTNLQELILFYDNRRQSTMTSAFDPETRTLTASIDLPVANSPRDGTPLGAPAISVPMRFGGGTIESVTLDGQMLELNNLIRTGDGVMALIAATPGAHRLTVVYAAP